MKLRLVTCFFFSAAFFLMGATLRADSLSGVLFVGGPAGGPPETWSIEVTNNGATTASNVEISLAAPLVQTAGAACTAVFNGPIPLGDIAPGATADSTDPRAYFSNFFGCPEDAAFNMDFAFSADGGAETGSLVLQNFALDEPIGFYPTPTTTAPEPSSLLLLGVGLAGLLGVSRRKLPC